jgi:hypothetical protein
MVCSTYGSHGTWLTVPLCRLPDSRRIPHSPVFILRKQCAPTCTAALLRFDFLSNAQGADMEEANPGGWALQCGQNFSVNHAPSNIDFAAIHVWPDNWERCVQEELQLITIINPSLRIILYGRQLTPLPHDTCIWGVWLLLCPAQNTRSTLQARLLDTFM